MSKGRRKLGIPMWLAVGVTVLISLPFGLWLGVWNLPVWMAFCVWAQYFALGARPRVLRTIFPAVLLGVLGAVWVLLLDVAVVHVIPDVKLLAHGDVATGCVFFVGFSLNVYIMKYLPLVQGPGSLPYFQAISLTLASYSMGQYLPAFGVTSAWLAPLVCGFSTLLACWLGACLGWFNVAIMAEERGHEAAETVEPRLDRLGEAAPVAERAVSLAARGE